jgi:site-specific DNA recombinase
VEKNKLKIGIYCRVSSLKQIENTSLKNQKDNGIRFCKNNGWEYEIFSESVSGGKEFSDRNMFNSLSDKLLNKELDGIWFNYWDRGWRNDRIKHFFIQLVKDSGCKVYVGNELKDILSDEGSFELGFFSLMSDYERRKIKSRLSNGIKRRLENEEIFLGISGIGYKKVGKKLVVDESEKDIIINCFEKYLNTSIKSYRDCIKLMKREYGNNLDKRINEKSLSRILKDEKYKGIYNLKYENEEYKINIGRIISDDLFEKVNDKINKNKGKYRGNRKNNYLLDGKVYCSCCKNNMWVIGGNGYNYYKCQQKINNVRKKWDSRFNDENFKCNSINDNKISLPKLEKIIWEVIFLVIKNSESIREEYYKKYKSEKNNKGEFYSKMRFYEKSIEKEKNKKFGILDKLIEGEINKEEKDILSKGLDYKIYELNKKYVEVKEEFERYNMSDEIVDYVDRFFKDIDKKYNIERIEDKKRLIKKYIDNISVKRLGKKENKREGFELNIKFNLKDESLLINKDENIFNDKKNDYIIYISNLKNVQLSDLIYKNILSFNIIVLLDLSWKYIDYKKVIIDGVR